MRINPVPTTRSAEDRLAFESRLQAQLDRWSVTVRRALKQRPVDRAQRSVTEEQIASIHVTLREARQILKRFQDLEDGLWRLQKGGVRQLWVQTEESVAELLEALENEPSQR